MSLRIISESSARNLERGLTTGSGDAANLQDTYTSRLTKLVPVEAITAYPVFLSAASNISSQQAAPAVMPPGSGAALAAAAAPVAGTDPILIFIISWVFLVMVIVLRWRATMSTQGKAQWPAVIISAISFIIWVYVAKGDFGVTSFVGSNAVGQVFERVGAYRDFVSSLVLFAWTLMAPALYSGERD